MNSVGFAYEPNTSQNCEHEDGQDSEYRVEKDPLEGLGVRSEEKFYKLDEEVFAEPINFMNNDLYPENDNNVEHTFTFLDKVLIEQRIGKRKKYHIEIKDTTAPVCPEEKCNKKFSTITLLKAHVRKVHFAEQNHTCEICGMSFSAKYLLKRHKDVHEGSQVQCPVCKRQLSRRTNLSSHLRFVHRQGELKCNDCDQRFARRNQYVRHRQTTHKTQL